MKRCQQQGLTQNQPQAQDQGLSQNQPKAQIQAQNDNEPSLSEVGADNLIVSPSTEKVNSSEKSLKFQPKVTTNRLNKLPIRRPRLRTAKQPITLVLHDFDVYSLCQPQIGEVDVFDSDVEENLGQADDEESDHNDSGDSDFREWQLDGYKEPDSLSLDEEDDLQDKNESLDDIYLENDTQLRITIGHSSIHDDVGEKLLIVNKMARVFRQGKCVATKLLDDFKDNPNMDKGTIQKTLIRRFGVAVPDYTCWRARKLMKNVVEGRYDEGYKGIIKVLKNVMPQASRRICVLHFYKNFASLYPSAWFHCLFYIAANAYFEFAFKKAMDKIKDKDISAFHWLRDNEPLEHWARFKFDQTLKVDDNTNNFVESFNNAIMKHKGKPTYTMLEEIRKLIRARFHKRFQISADWDGKVTPFAEAKLKKSYRKLYDGIIHPIPDSCFWGESELPALDPPFELKKRGRPEKHKRRECRLPFPPQLSTIQLSGAKRCKKCKQLGHNSLTCGQPRDEYEEASLEDWQSSWLAKLPPQQQQHQGFQLSPAKLFNSEFMYFICFVISFLFKLLMLVVVLYLASLDLMYFRCFVFSFFLTSCHVVLHQG
ncbi:hypothetical protein Cgig2_030514 [Carnegiea gigantea]|uniref:Uncharacterized protein n=1 Tax=Carnegiea gigantea TaxID=171969 RepID=A0A9Q1K039_9CARY|nr:hypothetical protein Cgig2_030514 [Carnegiea gigantea]